MSDGMVELTGLWLHEDKNGEKYFSGNIGRARVLVFRNKYKEKDTHPDYNMYLARNRDEKENDDGQTQGSGQAGTQRKGEDIPF